MDNDLFWNSYTGVADIVLHASKGKRSLVEKRQVSRDTTAIGFYVRLLIWYYILIC